MSYTWKSNIFWLLAMQVFCFGVCLVDEPIHRFGITLAAFVYGSWHGFMDGLTMGRR